MRVRIELTVVDPARPGSPVDVAVEAAPGTRAEDLRAPLLAAVAAPAGAVLSGDDGRPLPPDARLGVPPLVRGAVLTCLPGSSERKGPASSPLGARSAPGFLALHVVAGPDAGQVLGLGPGRHRVGRAGRAEVRLEDPLLSREHAELDVGAGGVRVRDLGTTNGTRLGGEDAGPAWLPWPVGAPLEVGASVLVVRPPTAAAASVVPAGDGWLDVNRAPRLLPRAGSVLLHLPRPPAPPAPLRLSAVALLLPLALSVPLALLWGPTALLFGLAGPVMTLGTALGDRRGSRREHARRLAEHEEATAAVHREAERLRDAERAVLEALHPDPAAVASTALALGGRLWERRPTDPDVLAVRLGLGEVPSEVAVVPPVDEGAPAPPAPLVHVGAPVVLPLDETGVLGVSGPREAVLGAARAVVGQAVVLHSPRDLRVVVLSADAGSAWRWARWLPHALGGGAVAGAVVAPVVAALLADVDEHRARRRTSSTAPVAPRVLVVVDGAERLRAVPGLARLLADGPGAGVSAVCLDADAARLPLECTATLALDAGAGSSADAVLARTGRAPVHLRPDLVSARWAERLARALAPLRDATPVEGATRVPEAVRLLDLLATDGTDASRPEGVRARWRQRPRSTAALLGATADGSWTVDLRRDGPHVLIAGTTGAGKSELLASLVASLSATNRPDELSFVLVDYKGGAAFAEVAALPHVLGLVTDLDAHLTRRALTSLEAEVRRRERLLSAAGCRDLDEHGALRERSPSAVEALTRLVIVVDEFRVLAEELPEFLSGLVRLAAVGRSLGVHLVLATQRPAGVVSADIRANANLRIALRVRDDADSVDVVEAPDAARIGAHQPGRALARTGGGALVEVQTARVSGRAPLARAAPVQVDLLDAPPGRSAAASAVGDPVGPTDLEAIVAAVREAAEGLPRPASPWLPPLPDVLRRSDLPRGAPRAAGAPAGAVAYGLLDTPLEQEQRPLAWGAVTPLVVAGGPRSGRTGVLRAIAAGLSERSPADMHLHVVDGAGGGLSELAGLPHAGAVVPREDGERLLRLLRRLDAEVTRRQGGSRGGATTALLVDGADRLVADALAGTAGPEGDEVLALLTRLVAEGPAVGVAVVLAGDRTLLTSRLGSGVVERLVLAMPDPTDHLLAGLSARDVPERMPPGRAVLVTATGVHEAQVLVLEDDPGTAAQRAAAARLAEEARARWADVPRAALPEPVPAMPSRLRACDVEDAPVDGRGGVLLGVGGESVEPVHLPLGASPVQLVAGPPGSGRTSALLALGQRLDADGRCVVVVSPRRSALTAWAATAGAAVPDPTDAAAVDRALGASPQAAVLVDDAELLGGTAVEDLLVEHLRALATSRSGTGRTGACVVAGTSADLAVAFRGLALEVRRARCGLLLHPLGPADGDLLGVRLPRTGGQVGSSPSAARAGRATLVQRGEVTTVQLALPRPRGTPHAR